ncbi:hypothetical protein MRX96_015507 [Rhipicephalus microplus]
MHARFLFYRANQASDELVADYITTLRKLSKNYGLGDKQLPLDIMRREYRTCGIKNEAVPQRLLAEQNLTYQVTYNKSMTAEATVQHQRDKRDQSEHETKKSQGLIQAPRIKQKTMAEGSSCYRCNGNHAPQSYSFNKAARLKCKKKLYK